MNSVSRKRMLRMLDFIKNSIEKFELNIKDKIVLTEAATGNFVVTPIIAALAGANVYAITKGKGLAGPMKRFGISRTSHKSEKGVRTPGNLGAWTGSRQWRVAKAGQLGYQQRNELNKWLIRIGDKPEEINNKSGFRRYGIVKNQFVLVKGSVPGAKKRLVTITNQKRPNKKIPTEAPAIQHISK